MIEGAQAHLILGKDDDVPCMAVGDAALAAQGGHGGIHSRQGVDIQLVFHLLHQSVQNEAAGHGVVSCPVMVEVRQAQRVGHDVQLEFIQMGQQVLGQDQGIHGGEAVLIAQALALGPDEAGVEIGIVGHQHPVSDEVQEFGQHLFDGRCPHQHIVGNAGELHDLLIQRPSGMDKGLEAVLLHAALQHHGADLNNFIRPGAEAGGLQVKGHIFLAEGHLLIAVNHNAVIHIVDIVAFAAIEDLDILVGACHLGLARRLHGIGEGLGHAVVGDGDGSVPPGRRLLDGCGGIGQGVHVAHGGMQMQLHPLFPGGGILPLGHGTGHDGVGLEHHIVFKPVLDELALHPQDGAHLHGIEDGLSLFGLQEPGDPDGICVIRHIELDHEGIALGQLLVIHRKDLALDDDGAHIHGHLVHGNGLAPEGFSVNHRTVLLLCPGGFRCFLRCPTGGTGLHGG